MTSNIDNNRVINLKLIFAILATGLLTFSGIIVETSLNIGFPTFMSVFGVSIDRVQWMTTIYFLVVAIIVPISVFLTKRFRLKTLFLWANLLFTLGLLIDATAPSFSLLLFGRIIQGIGTGIGLPLIFTIILEQSPLNKIGLLMGIGSLIITIAPALGPTYGGLILKTMSWRWLFIFLLPVLMISFVLGITSIKQVSKTDKKVTLDMPTWLLVSVLLINFILIFDKLGKVMYPVWVAFIVTGLLINAVLIWLLIKRYNRRQLKLIDGLIFKNRRFVWLAMTMFLTQLGSIGLSFLVANFLQLILNINVLSAGLIVFPGAIMGALISPVGGLLLDKFGAKLPILLGVALQGVMAFILMVWMHQLNQYGVLIIYVLFMTGNGLTFSNVMTRGINALTTDQHSDGNSVYNTIQQFAGASGTAIAAAIVAICQFYHVTQGTSLGIRSAFGFIFVMFVIDSYCAFKGA